MSTAKISYLCTYQQMKINLFNINNTHMYHILVIKPRFKDSLTAVAISWTTASHVNEDSTAKEMHIL